MSNYTTQIIRSAIFPGFEGYELRVLNFDGRWICVVDVIAMIINDSKKAPRVLARITADMPNVMNTLKTHRFPGEVLEQVTLVADSKSICIIIDNIQHPQASVFLRDHGTTLVRELTSLDNEIEIVDEVSAEDDLDHKLTCLMARMESLPSNHVMRSSEFATRIIDLIQDPVFHCK